MLESFSRDLRAMNQSHRNIQFYQETVRQFASLLRDRGMPTNVAGIARDHVESWIERLLERFPPARAESLEASR
jgi:hypothetical protein